jgi:isoquinoline 1-oxidoreductase subunit beta
VTALTVGGGLAVGLAFPQNIEQRALLARISGKPWEAVEGTDGVEVGPWLVIAPDDTVPIRIGQSEMGQGVMTSCAMMVAEELECD